jgi:hypothetical protein
VIPCLAAVAATRPSQTAPPRDVERCRPGVESFRALGGEEPRAGEVVREQSGAGQANQVGEGRAEPAGRAGHCEVVTALVTMGEYTGTNSVIRHVSVKPA